MSFSKIKASNLFLIAGLAVLAVGGSQFWNTTIKPHLGIK